jgi:hypothetical protein
VRDFHERQKLGKVVDVELLVKAALIARDPIYIRICDLTEPEKNALESEETLGFFQQTKELKVSILTTACAAIIQ